MMTTDTELSLDMLIKARLDAKTELRYWNEHVERIDGMIKAQVPEGQHYDGETGSAAWELRKGEIDYRAAFEALLRASTDRQAWLDSLENIYRKPHSWTWHVRAILKRAPRPAQRDLEADLQASIDALSGGQNE